MSANYFLLLIGNDTQMMLSLCRFVKHAGYTADMAASFQAAVHSMLNRQYQAVITDIVLSDTKGGYLCRNLRKYTDAPILALADLSHKNLISPALSNGAADFMLKPPHPEEMLLRIETLIQKQNKGQKSSGLMKFRSFMMDLNRHKLYLTDREDDDHKEITLSPIEFDILHLFVNYPDTLLLYQELYRRVWDSDCLDDVRTVMVHVSNLRKKLDASGRGIIKTVRSAGYIFSDV